MLEQFVFSGSIMLSNQASYVQKDPGIIVGPIVSIFGYLLDFFYNLSAAMLPTEANTLGFAIILLTIAAKLIMLPLGIKSQKSMMVMQRLQPEMESIRKKYGNSSNPDEQRKMNIEIQKLYSDNKANPIMGCLPLFIQFPIFMALYYTMNQAYRFVGRLHDIYAEISAIIMGVPDYFDIMAPIVHPKLPSGMTFTENVTEDMIKVLGKFTQADWSALFAQIPDNYSNRVQAILDTKAGIENFFGIVLTENTGLTWPSIIIPVVCVAATFLTSYLSTKQSKSNDPNMKMQQNIMMVVMPVMIGFMTVGMPAGVGLYWAVSNITQIIQQVALNKIYNKPGTNNKDEIVDPKPSQK